MKNTLIIIALSCACFNVSAQRSISTDSTWITNSGGNFYSYHLVAYSNGEETTTKTLLGDTTQYVSKFQEAFVSQASNWANDIEITSDYRRRITELIRQDAAIIQQVGRSPLRNMLAPVATSLVDSTWKIRIDGKNKAFRFTVTAAGALRYKADTAVVRSVTYIGDVMRLTNWLGSGQSLDLYKFDDGRWYSTTRQVQLYLERVGPQNRTKELPEPLPIPAPPVAVVFDGGLVYSSGQYWRWSSAKKAWVTTKFNNQTSIKL